MQLALSEFPKPYIIACFASGILFAIIGIKASPIVALLLVIGIGVAILLFFYPHLGLLMTALLVPIERFGRFTDDTSEFTVSLMRLAGILVLGVLLLRRLIEKREIVLDKTFFLYLGYCIVAIISVTYTTDRVGTIRACSSVLANLLFFFLVINLANTRKLVMQTLTVWLLVSAIIGGYSIYDWYLGSGADAGLAISGELDPGKGAQSTDNRWSTIWHDTAELDSLSGKSLKRTMGSTSHSAVYGINLVLTIPFLLLFINLAHRPIVKWFWWGVLAIIGYNILLTNTRATILLAGIVGMMCWYKGLLRLSVPLILFGLCGGLVLFVYVVPDDVFNRILDLSNYTLEQSASLRIREEYFHAGIKAFFDSWLIGHGAANENIVPEYLASWSNAPSKTTVHNEYLQTLMELGIVGFFFLFSFAGLLLRYCYNIENRLKRLSDASQEIMLTRAIKIAMIATLIYAIQVEVFHFPLKGWWLLAGITVFMHKYSLQIREQKGVNN